MKYVMKTLLLHPVRLLWMLTLALGTASAVIASPKEVSSPRETVPPNIVIHANRPMMMLATSKDHTLFGPVYTDFEDIDGDGVIDTTFIPTFKYYGYFDATKCYSYSTGNGQFEPAELAAVAGGRYTCSPSQNYWSGNFLNWATMTRLDTVRKMLYGGKRSTDRNAATVLERANLSKDSHSFVKFYRGTDIRDYTPFTMAALAKTTGSNKDNTLSGGVIGYAGLSICNRSTEMGEGGTPVIRLAKGNYRLWATVEGTVCQWNASNELTSSSISNGTGVFGAKLARYFIDSGKGAGGVAHEKDPPVPATDGATYGSIGPELTVRVQVCTPYLLGEERCQAFPPDSTANYKPFGLLQEFGLPSTTNSAARTEFGVITGSYDQNLTAGALRKNMGDFADEIHPVTGVFCHSGGANCDARLADGRATGNGAIKALDSLVLFGRGGGTDYTGSNNQKPADMKDGTLPAWGNPVGEMVVQALQYYAAVTGTNPSSTSNDTAKGLPVVDWKDPLSNSDANRKSLYGNSICRPLYTLALSSSALSFDGQANSPFATLPNRSGDLTSYVNTVGTTEGLSNTVRSVGSVTGGFGDACSGKALTTLDRASGVCPEAPAIGGTYQVAGAALYGNTARIRTVPTPPADLKFIQDALKVKTLAASLSGGAARIEVPIPGTSPTKYVYITPESAWDSSGYMPAAMLTFASIASGPAFGSFIVTWNDALFGGDYDMDIAGFLRYDVITNARSPSGYSIRITTDIVNVGAGNTGTHGFSVMGTRKADGSTSDGRYLTHKHQDGPGALKGAEGFLCGDPDYAAERKSEAKKSGTNPDGTYNACRVNSGGNSVFDQDFPVTHEFDMVGADNVLIRDPLWYAAKYGSFTSSTRNSDGTYTDLQLPPNQESWDRQLADGTSGSDGTPDGYFLARRPDILEQQLRKALDALAKNSNAAPAVSSAQLVSDGFKYVAKFDSTTVSGDVEAYQVDDLGFFKDQPDWRAGQLLHTRTSGAAGDKDASRQIITNSGNTATSGVAFRWASLSADYKTQMTTASTNQLSETNASLVVDYLRGDQSKEGVNGLRQRGDNILGPLVNGTPWIQEPPAADYTDDGKSTGYRAFIANNRDRAKLLWVAANDGMLHAFNPASGAEVFAYVPGPLANRLAEIPLQRGTPGRTRLNNANFTLDSAESQPTTTVWPYVDGNPFTGDVRLSGTTGPWRTYAFSTLGRGGKAVFALDVTDVDALAAGEANASAIFRWQFTSEDDADLGYVTSDASMHSTSNQAAPIVRLNNGKFALMLGNGNKSKDGKAALFLLFMDGPNAGSWTGQYRKIVADSGSGNGLSTPTWVDLDGNGTADVIYAGDLKGNMWRFNVGSENPDDWSLAYGKPLYTAVYTQTVNNVAVDYPLPITTAPEALFRSSGGMMVTFGTGNAFQTGDFPRSNVPQRVYGIWDRPTFATGDRTLPAGLATLSARTYVRQSATSAVIVSAGADIDWNAQDGWYFNLPSDSEMVLSNPTLQAGVLVFTAVRPKTVVDDCTNTPNAALYTIDPISGRAERVTQDVTVIGTTKYINAATDISDQKVRVVSDRTKRAFTRLCRKGDPGCECTTTDGAETCQKATATCNAGQRALRATGQGADAVICYNSAPRLQWREIPGLRTDQ